MAAHFLSLSLFIMLLSFFIILNSLSSFNEEKARTIQYSLTLAFSSDGAELGLDPSTVDSPSQSFKEGDALDKLEGLFNSQISGVKIKRNRLGTLMKVTISAEDFGRALFAAGSGGAGSEAGILSIEDEQFGEMLVSFMDLQKDVPYQMDMVLHTSEEEGKHDDMSQERKLEISQTAAYAERLEALGMPKKRITAGIMLGEEGMLDLYFKRYAPIKFNPNNVYRPPASEE